MEIYVPTSAKEFSQRKLEEYAKYEKVINEGRKSPIWFMETFLGVKLMDYQKWMFMETWNKPFANIQVFFNILYEFPFYKISREFPRGLFIQKPIFHNIAVGHNDLNILQIFL